MNSPLLQLDDVRREPQGFKRYDNGYNIGTSDHQFASHSNISLKASVVTSLVSPKTSAVNMKAIIDEYPFSRGELRNWLSGRKHAWKDLRLARKAQIGAGKYSVERDEAMRLLSLLNESDDGNRTIADANVLPRKKPMAVPDMVLT